MAGGAYTTESYVDHHLTNLKYGELPAGTPDCHGGFLETAAWKLADCEAQVEAMPFWSFNVDTILFSVLAAIIIFLFFLFVARIATSGIPGRLQSAVEFLVDMVNTEAKNSVHGDIRFIAPVALVIFAWIALMNAFDFLPVDLLDRLMYWTGASESIHFGRLVPTADLNAPLGIAVGVLILCFFYSFKIKGVSGFVKEWFTAPFGSFPILWPINFVMNIIEYSARTVSLAMRLFGNMFAGEILFLLIATLGAKAALTGLGVASIAGHVVMGSLWAIFHILIVFLQAYIFMMLTLAYLGLAHEDH